MTWLRWQLMVTWLRITKPRWMVQMRRTTRDWRENGVPVQPHTFGGDA